MSGPVLKAKLHFGRQEKGRRQVKDGERRWPQDAACPVWPS